MMKARQIRLRILDDHAALERHLDAIDALTARFEVGGSDVGKELRELGFALFERFASHLAFEDEHLPPRLRAHPPHGRDLAERLEREHREQHELLRFLLERLQQESRPTLLVARELDSFSEYLRADMHYEESTLLAEELFDD